MSALDPTTLRVLRKYVSGYGLLGIEETTDMRYPETKLRRFRSVSAALAWLGQDGNYAWSGAASNDLPVCQQNWHRRFRKVYLMPLGWRPDSRQVRETVTQHRGSSYHVDEPWAIARQAWRSCVGQLYANGSVEFAREQRHETSTQEGW